MAIIAPILAFLGRFVGKVLQMAFGWATILLFGRVPESRQLLLAGVALASVAWLALGVGVLFPDIGAVLIAAGPIPDWIDEGWVRLGMLVAAVVLPLLIGIASLFLVEAKDRPTGMGRVVQVLRGYPYALALAFVLIFLLVVAPIRKVRSIVKRWEDAHIPVVVKPNGYEQVADDVEASLDAAGLEIERVKAPTILATPSKLLAAVGGSSVRGLVPDRLLVLKNRQLEVTIYPSDIAMSGSKEQVARSRAAMAATLTFTAAYQTVAKETQEIEDRLESIGKGRTESPGPELAEIDRDLSRLVVSHDDWQTLYRIRLQVERQLRRRESPDHGPHAATDRGFDPVGFVGDIVRRVVG